MMQVTLERIRRLSPKQKEILLEKVHNFRNTETVPQWSPVVPLQPNQGEQPIYFIHPMGSALFFYLPLLNHFGPQYNLYGIRGHGLEEGQMAFDSIPEMARCYLEAIRQHQPDGAIHLIGYSMGGLIAFEMAHQLQKSGAKAGFLALIDSYAFTKKIPFPGKEIRDEDERLLQQLLRSLDDNQVRRMRKHLQMLPTNQQRLEHVIRLAKEVGSVPVSYTIQELRRMFATYDAHLLAVKHFRPQPYAHQFLFLQCQDTSDTDSIPSIPWIKLAQNGFVRHRLPGKHSTIMREPMVQSVARHLQQALYDWHHMSMNG